MVFVILFAAGILAAVLLIVLAGRRDWPPDPAWRSGLRVGVLIAAARLTVLWAVFLWDGDTSDWRQLPGYVALVLNTIVELILARLWLDDPIVWRIVLTVLVLMTSLGLGQAIAYLASSVQPSSRDAV